MAPRFSLEDHVVQAKIVKVYDGDSITAEFPLPHTHFKLVSPDYMWTCRIVGIDTPELRSKNMWVREHAYKARDRVRELIMDRRVRMELGGFDKYGRVLVSVRDTEDRDVADLLIQEGLALSYSGGKKADWAKHLGVEE